MESNGVPIIRTISFMGFVFGVSLALPLYINSSFLSEYASERTVGLIYMAGSLLTLFVLALIPSVLSRIGNYKAAVFSAATVTLLLIFLTVSKTFAVTAFIFILYLAFLSLIYFNFDVFLERYSQEAYTGRIRGFFLTTVNFAYFISPFVVGLILVNGDYWKIYLMAAALTASLVYLLTLFLREFQDSEYVRIPFWSTFARLWRDGDSYKIFVTNFLLQFFFAWMVIYMPLYLHDHIGFSWSEIGIMFSIMLLPFVLLELPAGKIADTWLGEKEIMSVGFLIIALATSVIVFLKEPVFWIWALTLFTTRVGASLVEIMTETYFFKHVKSSDTRIIGFFRNNYPLAFLVAPAVASVFLLFFDIQYLFVALGIIMLLGLFYSLRLVDTR